MPSRWEHDETELIGRELGRLRRAFKTHGSTCDTHRCARRCS